MKRTSIPLIHGFMFVLLFALAAAMRARPFPWTDAVGAPTATAARVSVGRTVMKSGWFQRPEALSDALMTEAYEMKGAVGLSWLSLILFGAAFILAMDAARIMGGFGAAALVAVPLLPLAMGNSAPTPWLFSALFAAAFVQIIVRVRRRMAPPPLLLLLPLLTALWPLFHDAGILLGPFLSIVTAADCVFAWWVAEHAVQGGVFTAPQDPLLFQPENLDMPTFLRVLSWETRMNQFLHQRLEMTPEQLPSLTAGRAVEVLNSLLGIEDLPAQAGVPDMGVVDGDVRARNRKLLDIQYRDALKPSAPNDGRFDSDFGVIPPPPLWAPLTAAFLAVIAVAAPPAGPQALGRLFAGLSNTGSLPDVPPVWWVSLPRELYPCAPYFWTALILFLAAGLIGARNRERFSPAYFIGGLALFTVALPFPDAAPLVTLTIIPFAASFLENLWKEDSVVKTLSVAAAFLILIIGLCLADWDYMPPGADLKLGTSSSMTGRAP